MKITALLSIFLLSLICFSCQSEYERQLAHGKTLVKKEVALQNSSINDIHSGYSLMQLSEIQDDLRKCAHLSGNESLFQAEMVNYKSNLEEAPIDPSRLISKYP